MSPTAHPGCSQPERGAALLFRRPRAPAPRAAGGPRGPCPHTAPDFARPPLPGVQTSRLPARAPPRPARTASRVPPPPLHPKGPHRSVQACRYASWSPHFRGCAAGHAPHIHTPAWRRTAPPIDCAHARAPPARAARCPQRPVRPCAGGKTQACARTRAHTCRGCEPGWKVQGGGPGAGRQRAPSPAAGATAPRAGGARRPQGRRCRGAPASN
jgi:hypothetical protein